MIVGGYDLHLYCDSGRTHGYRLGSEQFAGETFAECAKAAKRVGWKLLIDSGKAICPDCAALERPPAASQEGGSHG